jgi:hypothetical protein
LPGDIAPPRTGGAVGAGAGLAAAAPAPAAAAAAKGGKSKAKEKEKEKEKDKAPAPAPVAEKPISLAALAQSQASGDDMFPESPEGDYDLDIGEASRVVKLDMLVPPPRGDAAPPVTRTGLPGMTGAQKVPRGTGGQPIIAGGIVADDVNPSAAILQPKKSSKHGLVFWVGGGAMVAIVGVLMIILLRGGDSRGDDMEAESPRSAFVEGFYSQDNQYGVIPGLAPSPKDPNAPVADVKGKKAGPRPGARPQIASTDPGRRPSTEDLGDVSGAVGERDAEEVLDAQRRFGAGLKWCFERQLKLNPDLKGANNRYDVQITITATGGVRAVSVAGKDSGLKECVRQKISTWNFKPARGDFTTQFPIVFN